MPLEVQRPVPVWEFTQRFSATPGGARLARRAATHRLDVQGVPRTSELASTATLIVAELAANAATHGRVRGRAFELRLSMRDTKAAALAATHNGAPSAAPGLYIEVSDTRTERTLPAHLQLPSPEQESGRGLLLVAALAEEWGVRPRSVGKTVWVRCGVGGGG